jgi:lysyl-tRNA synthetase class 1
MTSELRTEADGPKSKVQDLGGNSPDETEEKEEEFEEEEEEERRSENERVIGRGTWLDRVAKEIVEREKRLGRNLTRIRVESGLGASGIPHIGSLGDAARAYGVKMALEEAGFQSELIAYSDDMDALRKVPAGLPSWLEGEIGKPVSEIRDPFDCHGSYGAHMSGLLIEGLEALRLSYIFQSGYEAYKKGLLLKEIDLILKNAKRIGEKIEEMTGQTKFEETLPYFPRCAKCGRLNVAHADGYDPSTKKVHYRCVGDEIGKKWIEGCGYEGYADITKGEGKLSWKVEFAARWAALDIRYEAHGKELRDSVKINDWVCENVLGFPPPYHVVYELFQDKSGRKISKSTGNLVTPQKWLSLASPKTLLLFYFKRIIGSRNISEEDIPSYMEEYDQLEDLYFGKVREPNKMKEIRLKGIYYYVNLRNPPQKPSQHVPYNLLAELATVAPREDPEGYIAKRLLQYRVIKEVDADVKARIRYAINWSKEFSIKQEHVELSERERNAIRELSSLLSKKSPHCEPQEVQSLIFETARNNGIEPSQWFKLLYKILLGIDRGPRLGNYICDVGLERVRERLNLALN